MANPTIKLMDPKHQVWEGWLDVAELKEKYAQLLSSGQYVGGPVVEALKERFKADYDLADALPCASGTDALYLAVEALKRSVGQDLLVVCPDFTYMASVDTAVRSVGQENVALADVNMDTLMMSVESAINAIMIAMTTGPVKNVLVVSVHLYGSRCPTKEILEALRARFPDVTFYSLEDAAQAQGTEGVPWTGSDFVAYSFFPTKSFGGIGDGGMIGLPRKRGKYIQRAWRELLKMAKHGTGKDKYDSECIGFNSRLNPLSATLVLEKMKIAHKLKQRAQDQYALYVDALKPISGVKIVTRADCHPSLMVVQFANITVRREVIRALRKANIGHGIYYPKAIHKQAAFQGCINCGGVPSNSIVVSKRVLALPFHTGISSSDIGYVAEAIRRGMGCK